MRRKIMWPGPPSTWPLLPELHRHSFFAWNLEVYKGRLLQLLFQRPGGKFSTMKLTSLIFITSLFYQAYGKNDWSKACLDGTCSFHIEEGAEDTSGTIEIVLIYCYYFVGILALIINQSGSSSAISDITPAAGWKILDCMDSTNTQTIRLVCVDENKGCAHLFQEGAQDTVVRLPEDVSKASSGLRK